jgi:transposase
VASPGLEPLALRAGERQVLEGWARRHKTSQALALRSRIVLACADGGSVTAVAADLRVSRDTVRKWRGRFQAARLHGLEDEPRPGAPRKITDEQVELVIAKALDRRGPGPDTCWSTRSIAAATGMSQSAVSRIWRAFGLRPHLVETWQLSTDPQFVGKVRDIVGLYLDPQERALALAVDEKDTIQIIERTAPVSPGTPARVARDYVRCIRDDTAGVFATPDAAGGPVIAAGHRRHRHQEFLRFLRLIDTAVPGGLDLHLICDSPAAHETESVRKWLGRHPRFHLHLTPTRSAWANLAERWFAELAARKLRRSARRGGTDLEAGIRRWIGERNAGPEPFMWAKPADQILGTLAAYCR